jgi:hypothetical protein
MIDEEINPFALPRCVREEGLQFSPPHYCYSCGGLPNLAAQNCTRPPKTLVSASLTVPFCKNACATVRRVRKLWRLLLEGVFAVVAGAGCFKAEDEE